MDQVTTEEVRKIIKQTGKKPIIVDVREHDEVAAGKIPGAKHIPLGELPNRLNELSKDEEHIMVCRSGSRSSMATDFLERNGFKVKNMVGGMMNWQGETE